MEVKNGVITPNVETKGRKVVETVNEEDGEESEEWVGRFTSRKMDHALKYAQTVQGKRYEYGTMFLNFEDRIEPTATDTD